MSFSGFDQHSDLEAERRKFLERGLRAVRDEKLATYVWGEDSYDGLGDALQEGGDELNDETFGGPGAVGKDFDFSSSTLPLDLRPPAAELASIAPPTRFKDTDSKALQPTPPARPPNSLESIWDDKSPFSVLPKMNGSANRHSELQPAPSTTFSPFDSQANSVPSTQSYREPVALSMAAHQTHGVRTLEEIEAEMREAFAAQRNQNVSPSQSHALSQIQHRATPQRHAPPQHAPTPPPRMHPHSQSPRFHHQQQQHQILLLQQQQQRQLEQDRKRQLRQLQQLQLLELQEQQLRLEEVERQRQIVAQQAQLSNNQYIQQHQRHTSTGRLTPSIADIQQRRFGHHSPALAQVQQQIELPFQQSLQYLPRDIQMQQRMLAEMAQAEFLTNMQGSDSIARSERTPNDDQEQEILRAEAVRKIMEAERMEEKRRRKLEKIRYMSRYNDLMTQSDKDFITRIQVSQLVTQDPYADDFYAQVYGAVMRSRMGVTGPEAVLKFGSGGGVGLGLAQGRSGRRPSAMQRMEAQVERIVNNARMREKEKTSLNSLQGALGKTSGRSYKAAPRQLLQVDASANAPGGSPTLSHATPHAHISKADAFSSLHRDGAGVAAEAAKFGKQALGDSNATDLVLKDPLTHREALIILERLYDLVLDMEQQKREEPEEEEVEAILIWEEKSGAILQNLWDGLQVMVPLDTSDPHPFISLLTPIKGKKLLPRATRHFSTQQSLTLLTLLVACFSQLDVVVDAGILDGLEETQERKDVDAQTQAFLGSVMQSLLPMAANAGLRLVSGILGVFLERNDVVEVSKTKPGIAMLTMFLSRVEVIKQSMTTASDASEIPSEEEVEQWQIMFDHLFQLLAPHLALLFPSVRQALVSNVPILEVPDLDTIDQPVWQFLAALALNASLEQQQVLVTSLRERVLENVTSAMKGWVPDEETRKIRLANVNIFLHALGLDSSQIAL